MTSPRCRSDEPEVAPRVPVRRASAGSVFAAIQAGATPKRQPVSSERVKVKVRTEGEGRGLMGRACASGKAKARRTCVPA